MHWIYSRLKSEFLSVFISHLNDCDLLSIKIIYINNIYKLNSWSYLPKLIDSCKIFIMKCNKIDLNLNPIKKMNTLLQPVFASL